VKLPPVPEPLRHVASVIEGFCAHSIAFSLGPRTTVATGNSKLGGTPDLPAGFELKGESAAVDFLLQINLGDVQHLDEAGSLPTAGLLSFFYDLKERPRGYDPKRLNGFRVHYTPSQVQVLATPMPRPEFTPEERPIAFRKGITLPHFDSTAYWQLSRLADLYDEEAEAYDAFLREVETYGRQTGGNHRLLGHAENIQGDMQLQAQLVTNGLYCGNSTGYEDPRRNELEARADDWMLLLQLDSDETAGLMWGDVGMLYYWIRKQDLAIKRFDRVWMTMQFH
jgi:uncharacterized protein YwqG